MRQIQTIATTIPGYDADRKRWHKPGVVAEQTSVYLRVVGAQIKHDEPVSTITATEIGHHAIVVTIEPTENVQTATEQEQ